jgi:hypothetical protein
VLATIIPKPDSTLSQVAGGSVGTVNVTSPAFRLSRWSNNGYIRDDKPNAHNLMGLHALKHDDRDSGSCDNHSRGNSGSSLSLTRRVSAVSQREDAFEVRKGKRYKSTLPE